MFKIEFHSEFFKDLKKLDKSEKERVYEQILKIQKDPERYVHLSGVQIVTRSDLVSYACCIF